MQRVVAPKGPPSSDEGGPDRVQTVACPHLGLASDQFARYGGPSPEHRCYLWMARERIDRAHQQRFCLAEAHAHCPWKAVTRREPTGEPEGLGTRLGDAIRERFDELERATLRSNWPRAVLAIVVFLAGLLVAGSREAARILKPQLQRIGHLLLKLGRQGVTRGLPRLGRGSVAVIRWTAARGGAVGRAVAALPRRKHRPVIYRNQSPVPLTGEPPSLDIAEDEQLPVGWAGSPITPEPVDEDLDFAPSGAWTCDACGTENVSPQTFCQSCHRLSMGLEAHLRKRAKIDLLDGLKAIELGSEEAAFRAFVLATVRFPSDTLAWRWRARTAPTVSDVVASLEKLVRLKPDDRQLQADLVIARSRLQSERGIASPPPRSTPAAEAPPSVAQRALSVVRRLALEIASIPAFALGILVAGQPVRDLLAMLDLGDYATLLPAFHLPTLIVHLPPSLQPDFLPEVSADLVGLGLIVVAAGYFYLAFRLADGSPGSRWVAVLGGVIAVGSLHFTTSGGGLLFACGLLLALVAGIGQETPIVKRAQIVRTF